MHYSTGSFDLTCDQAIDPQFQTAYEHSILIVDGTFLQRKELRRSWDYVIFLDVQAEVARQRAVERTMIGMAGGMLIVKLFSGSS